MDANAFGIAVPPSARDRACGPASLLGPALQHLVMTAGALVLSTAVASGQVPACEPQWLPTLGPIPGANGPVMAALTWDDGLGSGPALYVAGAFDALAGRDAHGIARFDGQDWSTLGSGLQALPGATEAAQVRALAIYDAGSGPALYAAGRFALAGGVPCANIARWDGVQWAAVPGAPALSDEESAILALEVFDAGQGQRLHVAGQFTEGVMSWDGGVWASLAGGITAPGITELALEVHDDGTGAALYMSGSFKQVGGQLAAGIARWDGLTWTALGTAGIHGDFLSAVLLSCDLGAGPRLYMGGYGSGGQRLLSWDGASWTSIFPSAGSVLGLAKYDDGTGSHLIAGGTFIHLGGLADPVAHFIARWEGGSQWSQLGNGMAGPVPVFVEALHVFDDGSGAAPRLFVGGSFTEARDSHVGMFNMAFWDGAAWSACIDGGLDADVRAMTVFDDGTGEALYVSGRFSSAQGQSTLSVGRWDGSSWSPVGGGLGFGSDDYLDNRAESLQVHDDGSGPALYAAGSGLSSSIPPIPSSAPRTDVMRWDGNAWQPVGLITDPLYPRTATDMAWFDDGSGEKLYVSCGDEGGTPDNLALFHPILRFDGTQWESIASPAGYVPIFDLQVFDSGSGPELYAAGGWGVRRWDSQAGWQLVGNVTSETYRLAVFDDGGGPQLYCGRYLGGDPAITGGHFARWNGSTWSMVDASFEKPVVALEVFDVGSGLGPALYIGTRGNTSTPSERLYRWNGTSVTPVGLQLEGSSYLELHGTASWQGGGPQLFVGGGFDNFPETSDAFLTRLSGCTDWLWEDIGGGTLGSHGTPTQTAAGPLTDASNVSISLDQVPPGALMVYWLSFASVPTPFVGGTLYALPHALQRLYLADATGQFDLHVTWATGLPSGTEFWLQFLVQDPSVFYGITLSNALKGTTP